MNWHREVLFHQLFSSIILIPSESFLVFLNSFFHLFISYLIRVKNCRNQDCTLPALFSHIFLKFLPYWNLRTGKPKNFWCSKVFIYIYYFALLFYVYYVYLQRILDFMIEKRYIVIGSPLKYKNKRLETIAREWDIYEKYWRTWSFISVD